MCGLAGIIIQKQDRNKNQINKITSAFKNYIMARKLYTFFKIEFRMIGP